MTQFRSQKIKKPKLIGIPGTANLVFNIKQFRYYEEEGYSELNEISDDARRGLPKDGVYSPFDKEYGEMSAKETLEETIKSTDWEKFIERSKRNVQVEREQEQRDIEDRTMLELGLDPSMDEQDAYDMDASNFEQEEFGPDNEGFDT